MRECSKIRNTTYEVEKTDQEQKRAQEKGASNVEDVWKRGYGDGDQITLLFLGLARAAGLDASAARISTREDHFFVKTVMKAQDLRTYRGGGEGEREGHVFRSGISFYAIRDAAVGGDEYAGVEAGQRRRNVDCDEHAGKRRFAD